MRLHCAGGMRDAMSCGVDEDCRGPVYVYHEGLLPSTGPHNTPTIIPTSYLVQFVDPNCNLTLESSYSQPLEIVTSKRGDTVQDLTSSPYPAPDGIVGITDVLAILAKFQNLAAASVSPRVDLIGAAAPKYIPDHLVDITDVLQALFAFQAVMYPPSSITGVPNAPPCGASMAGD